MSLIIQKWFDEDLDAPALAGDITGTVSVTEADDTLSASGLVTVTGSVSVTEANDTSAASGLVTVTGTLAVTEENDSSAASGLVIVAGTISVTEQDDTCSASGDVEGAGITGTIAVTEADDTSAAAGEITIIGAADVLEANDTLSAVGDVAQPAVDGRKPLGRPPFRWRRRIDEQYFERSRAELEAYYAELERREALAAPPAPSAPVQTSAQPAPKLTEAMAAAASHDELMRIAHSEAVARADRELAEQENQRRRLAATIAVLMLSI